MKVILSLWLTRLNQRTRLLIMSFLVAPLWKTMKSSRSCHSFLEISSISYLVSFSRASSRSCIFVQPVSSATVIGA